jgi:hypothetical protein
LKTDLSARPAKTQKRPDRCADERRVLGGLTYLLRFAKLDVARIFGRAIA